MCFWNFWAKNLVEWFNTSIYFYKNLIVYLWIVHQNISSSIWVNGCSGWAWYYFYASKTLFICDIKFAKSDSVSKMKEIRYYFNFYEEISLKKIEYFTRYAMMCRSIIQNALKKCNRSCYSVPECFSRWRPCTSYWQPCVSTLDLLITSSTCTW